MSIQQSLLSFVSRTPRTKKETDPDAIDVTPTNVSTPKLDISSPNVSSKNGARKENSGIATSTPKRKKEESAAAPRKKRSKASTPQTHGRVEIVDDEDEDENKNSIEVQANGSASYVFHPLDQDASIPSRNDTTVESMGITNDSLAEENSGETEFEHTKLDFLKPENIRDLNMRTPDHEDYDPTTLYVPEWYLKDRKRCTPALRVWWKFKSENFDKILLYKLGKFYELYHMDAILAVELLNLSLMKCSENKRCAHCGFPESAFGRFSDQLVQKGYKVARIEQTETPEMKDKRLEKMSGKKAEETDKIIRRELCRVITPGTKTYGFLDGADGIAAPKLLYAICEIADANTRRFGVCFVDCAVGKIWMGEFEDDYHCSRLRTLFAQHPPVEVLFPRRRISQSTEGVLNGLGGSCILEPLVWKSQFLTSTDALKKISSNRYFVTDEDSKAVGVGHWPSVLRDTLDEGDVLGSKCKKECELSVSALGAIIWHLEKCLIDSDILPLKLFEKYEPPSCGNWDNEPEGGQWKLSTRTMILDAAALKNLDVLQSSSKPNSTEGTLLELLDSCSSAFGKRLLRCWLCNPLCQIDAIRERQEAIGVLLEEVDFSEHATSLLKQLPDLERMLQKIHAMGTKKRQNHPDSRAVLFESKTYDKRKVDDFLATLDGLKNITEISDLFQKISRRVKSALLRRCLLVITDEGGRFPNMLKHLADIESKFSRKAAQEKGILVLKTDVADADSQIEACRTEFELYLGEQRKKFSCSKIKYATCKGDARYALEIPEAVAERLSNDYKHVGQVKGIRRVMTNRLEELVDDMKKAEENRDATFADSMRRVFELFSEKSGVWRQTIDCAATLDVLLSLSRYAKNCEHAVCVPNVVAAGPNQKPFIEITNGYHPCSAKIFTTLGQFVPNDAAIGKGDYPASVLLLTGPNMGGKSTLMRQVASLIVLAQIGSHVPAESCSFSVVDRVFTRLGASDRICSNQSTFAVELTETNMILRHATVHSLVVMDELGRGTATHDGAAIAYAVLKHLAENGGPRVLFSTHYHSLVARFQNHRNVALGHMACSVENENDDDPSEETITFLYKLAPGACPKSHGFHAAKLAGISGKIVKKAHGKAKEIESMADTAQRLRALASGCSRLGDEELVTAVRELLTIE